MTPLLGALIVVNSKAKQGFRLRCVAFAALSPAVETLTATFRKGFSFGVRLPYRGHQRLPAAPWHRVVQPRHACPAAPLGPASRHPLEVPLDRVALALRQAPAVQPPRACPEVPLAPERQPD
jgi:hypothetical protein